MGGWGEGHREVIRQLGLRGVSTGLDRAHGVRVLDLDSVAKEEGLTESRTLMLF